MRIQTTLTLFATLAAATLPAFAQTTVDRTIDDFTTGRYQSPAFFSGSSHDNVQYGKMMGGSRDTNMYICPTTTPCPTYNPYNQPSSYSFSAGSGATYKPAFVQTAGFEVGPRIDMGYGYHGTSMNEDFTPYQKIRVNFKGLTQTLNFNIQLFTTYWWAQGGCNIPAYAGEFAIELPINKFITTSGFNISDVTAMDFIFQDGSYIAGVDFAITSIELTNTTKPGNTISCHY
jgi:hypothetical protein